MAAKFALQDWQVADPSFSFRETQPPQRRPAHIAAKMIGSIAGYIAKHWRGQLPLAQSFGLGALVVVPCALWFVLSGITAAAQPTENPSRLIFSATLSFAVFVLADIWSATGIWRCARKHNKFARPIADWAARTTQAAVVVNFLVLLAATVLFGAQLRAIVVRPHENAYPSYEVVLRGNTAVFRGRMSQAAASELELLLRDKSVSRLAIADSSGGEAAAALPLAKLVHGRKLFVVALANCDPACLFLLAAGSVRAILPETRLQFGSGIDNAIYRQAGLVGMPFDALRASAGTPFAPTLRTLIANGFVTSIFVLANRRYARATDWCVKNPVACNRPAGQNVGGHRPPGGG